MDNVEEKNEEDTKLTFHPLETDADFLSAPQMKPKLHPEVMKLLSESFAKPLSKKARVSLAKGFPTPSSLRPSRLDTPMRLLVDKQVVSHDRFLQKLQLLLTDGAGPLVGLLNRIHKGEPLSDENLRSSLEQALRMMGNFHAHPSQERQGCVLRAIAPSLQHMELEDFRFEETHLGTNTMKE